MPFWLVAEDCAGSPKDPGHPDFCTGGWNDIVMDGGGNAYVNATGFDPMAGEP